MNLYKHKKIFLSIFLSAIFCFNSLSLIADDYSPEIQKYMDDLLKWRKEVALPPLPKLITLPSGITIPEFTLKTEKYPEVFWDGNMMIGATPFIVRVLTENETEILIKIASEALTQHYNSRSKKSDMGFEKAHINDFYALSIAEVYRHSGLFGPTVDGSTTFVLIMKKDVNPSNLFPNEKLYKNYIPWAPSGIHFLVIERFSDGSFKVNNEGAAG